MSDDQSDMDVSLDLLVLIEVSVDGSSVDIEQNMNWRYFEKIRGWNKVKLKIGDSICAGSSTYQPGGGTATRILDAGCTQSSQKTHASRP